MNLFEPTCRDGKKKKQQETQQGITMEVYGQVFIYRPGHFIHRKCPISFKEIFQFSVPENDRSLICGDVVQLSTENLTKLHCGLN